MSQSKKIIEVVIPTGIGKTLHYSVPPTLEPLIQPGMRVRVPLGTRQATGYVVRWVKTAAVSKLRDILEILDETPFLDRWFLDFTRWAADYYLAPWGRLLQYAIPPLAQGKGRRAAVRISAPDRSRQEPSPSVRAYNDMPVLPTAKPIIEAVSAGSFKVFLLQGRQRSSIYLYAISAALTAGKGCLVLVPEIHRIEPFATQAKAALGVNPFLLHSDLSPRRRLETWLEIRAAKTPLVIGTRSALFASISNLGLIVVDEEQDSAYKQEESPRYHARDLSVVRARGAGAPVLLGSAAPSMESYNHFLNGKYQGVVLTDSSPLSLKLKIVDLREAPRSGFLSQPLKEAIVRHIAQKELVALLINRRGFAHGILCRDCGHTARCPACSIPLAYSKESKQLRCHHCGRSLSPPDRCPDCHGSKLVAVGSGTERVVEEVKALLPYARIERLDRDRVHGKIRRREVARLLDEKKPEIVIGTQLLLSWLELPPFSLIGFVWADQGLHFPDFRASERTFQLLTTFLERSKNEALIQTCTPDHPAIRFAVLQDYSGFAQAELQGRKALGLPPYGRLIRIVVKGLQETQVQRSAESLATILRRTAAEGRDSRRTAHTILGPAQAPISKIRGRYRWHILLCGQNPGGLHDWAAAGIQAWSKKKPTGGIRLEIDVDPVQML
jgi:primosomal protein N' (replication factor Y)